MDLLALGMRRFSPSQDSSSRWQAKPSFCHRQGGGLPLKNRRFNPERILSQAPFGSRGGYVSFRECTKINNGSTPEQLDCEWVSRRSCVSIRSFKNRKGATCNAEINRSSLKLTAKAPENGSLEDDPFLLVSGMAYFQRLLLIVLGRVGHP